MPLKKIILISLPLPFIVGIFIFFTVKHSRLHEIPLIGKGVSFVERVSESIQRKSIYSDGQAIAATIHDAEQSFRTPQTMWITAYYTVWGVCGIQPHQIDWSSLTHIVHQQIEPSSHGRLWQFPRAFHDDDTAYFEQGLGAGCGDLNVQQRLISLAHEHKKKVLLGLGGAGKGADDFRFITSDRNRIRSYVNSILRYARKRGYDGVDLDWEFVMDTDEEGFKLLLRTLRDSLNRWSPKGILTLAIPGWYDHRYGYNTSIMNATADQVNLMTYDLAGGWNKYTGHNAPAFKPTFADYDGLDITSEINAWIRQGLDARRIGLGLPFFGYSWKENTAPGQRRRSEAVRQISYIDVVTTYAHAKEAWDNEAKVPWRAGRNSDGVEHFISYENERSLSYKVNLAKSMGLGGIMVFELWRGIIPEKNGAVQQPLLAAVKEAAWGKPKATKDLQIVLAAPANRSNRVKLDPTLRWKPTKAGITYEVQVSKSAEFEDNGLVLVEKVGNDEITLPKLVGKRTYYWRVRPLSTEDAGEWSKIWSFTTR